MILYSRLDIYPNRDGFIYKRDQQQSTTSLVNVKDKTPQALRHDLHKRTQNKNPVLRANSKILYSTIADDGSANANAEVV